MEGAVTAAPRMAGVVTNEGTILEGVVRNAA